MIRLALAGWTFVLILAVTQCAGPAPDAEASAHAESTHPALVICDVFGRRHCADALNVSWCESRFDTDARNGQYLGLFQMGSWERRRFGHGRGAWAQARAAHRYFLNSGSDWSPWTCRYALKGDPRS